MKNDVGACSGCSCRTQAVNEPIAGVSRRQFVAIGAYAAAAAALAACGGSGEIMTAPVSLSTTLNVADFSALATVGGVATTNVNGSPVALVRVSATSFLVLSRVCPHQGSTVNATSTGFKCPNHGATFDKSGTWVSGQQTSSMRSYANSYDASTGKLTIG